MDQSATSYALIRNQAAGGSTGLNASTPTAFPPGRLDLFVGVPYEGLFMGPEGDRQW